MTSWHKRGGSVTPLHSNPGSEDCQLCVNYCKYHQNDASPAWDHLLPSTSLRARTTSGLASPSTSPASESPGPNSTSRERRAGGKGKKAPPPPAETLSPSSQLSSPSQARLSGENFQPEKSCVGQHRKTNSVDSVETLTSTSTSTSLYPSLPPGPETFPVPAPRNIKPALPSKPEGISR